MPVVPSDAPTLKSIKERVKSGPSVGDAGGWSSEIDEKRDNTLPSVSLDSPVRCGWESSSVVNRRDSVDDVESVEDMDAIGVSGPLNDVTSENAVAV